MSETQKLHTLLRLYENTVDSNREEIDKEDRYLGVFYPILDPRAKLPQDFPDIGNYVKRLGKKPKQIRHNFEDMTISFTSGEVFYVFDLEDFRYYPKSLSLKDHNHFNKIDEVITFDLLKDEDICENSMDWNTHYLINDKRVLKVTVKENDVEDYGERE